MIALDAAGNPVVAANGYALRTIPTTAESPFDGHLYGEIVADDDAREFWAHDVLVRTNGLDSVLEACRRYSPLDY